MFPYDPSQFELGYVETEGFLHDQVPQEALELIAPARIQFRLLQPPTL